MFPIAPNEAERLSALRSLKVLDTPAESHFDAVCRAAQALFSVPVVLVSFMDENRQWFKAKCGLNVDGTARDVAFCNYALLSDSVFVVEDATIDERFANNPLVTGGMGIRFYAGAPLTLSPGIRVGTLCIIDMVPRAFSEEQARQLQDLAEIVIAHLRLYEEKQRYKLLADNTTDVIIWCRLDTTRLYVSPSAKLLFGYDPEDLIGTRPLDFVHPDDSEGYRRILDDLQNERVEHVVSQQRYRRKDGSWVWIEASFSLIRDANTAHATSYVAALRDVTQRKDAESKIAHMALHDALTGLPNRTLFWDRLNQTLASGERHGYSFAVIACDLDRFKSINDTLGHPAGDTLLKTVAERLKGVIREGDTVARLGGDEFAFVLGRLDQPQDASLVAQRIIDAVGEPIHIDGHQTTVGVSVGIAIGPADDLGADDLFKNADIALYRAKEAGRNRYSFYETGMDAQITERNLLELDMREAIRLGGFILHYQPAMNFVSGEVSGFEALLRWQHPTRGAISPAEFIPMAEETGLIVALGEWALREACREAASWPKNLRIAVNVSAVQFQKPGLEQVVLSALMATGLAPSRLELEITESVLMEDANAVIGCLQRLTALGVRIALDDFGTGYSSLSYLRRFPFDKIKIDRSFVREIDDPNAAAIVRAVVGLATHLGADITAEGIETEDQFKRVRQIGCTEFQGFLLSRPLPAQDTLRFIRAKSTRIAA